MKIAAISLLAVLAATPVLAQPTGTANTSSSATPAEQMAGKAQANANAAEVETTGTSPYVSARNPSNTTSVTGVTSSNAVNGTGEAATSP